MFSLPFVELTNGGTPSVGQWEVQATRVPRHETATWPVNDSCEVDYEEAQGRQGRQGAEM